MNRPSSKFGVLFLGTEPGQTWQIADPTDDETGEAYLQLRGAAYPLMPRNLDTGEIDPPMPARVEVDRKQLQRVLSLAEAYLFLGTYELGTACVLDKLREVRRVLRDMGRAA